MYIKRILTIICTSFVLLIVYLLAMQGNAQFFDLTTTIQVLQSLHILFYLSIVFFATILVVLWTYPVLKESDSKKEKLKFKGFQIITLVGVSFYMLLLGSQSSMLYRQVYMEASIQNARVSRLSSNSSIQIKVIGAVSDTSVSYFMYEGLGNQPGILLEGIEEIVLCEHNEFQEIRRKMGLDEALAFSTSYNNMIHLDASLSSFHRVLTHELAHIFDFKHGMISRSESFDALYQSLKNDEEVYRLSAIMNVEYALSSSSEMFAELSDAYFNDPIQLEHLSTSVYDYFNQVYRGGAK